MSYRTSNRSVGFFRGATVTVADIHRDREERDIVRGPVQYIAGSELPRPGDDLPVMQKLALLQMMNSTFARGVAKKFASNEGIQARPSLADYCALSRRFLCERLDPDGYHELTYDGAQTAKAVLGRLCADLDIHACQVESVEGTGKHARTYYRCPCGGWGRVYNGNGQFTFYRALNDFHAHWNPKARGVEA